jgi:hypothetical protein
MSDDMRLDILSVPGVYAVPVNESQLVTNLIFVPLARKLGGLPGVMVDKVEFGAFRVAWNVGSAIYHKRAHADIVTAIRIHSIYDQGSAGLEL